MLVALASVLARVITVLALRTSEGAETFEYEDIARNIVSGAGFGFQHLGTWYRTFGSPPYSLLCAAVYGIFGHSHVAMLVVQAVLSGFTVWAAGVLAGILFADRFGHGTSLVAATLIAFHPALFYTDTHKLHPLGLDALLASLGLLGLLGARDRWPHWVWMALGCLHGMCLFERPTFVGLIPLTWLRVSKLPEGRRMRGAAWHAMGVAVLLAPWLLRSVALFGTPVLSSTDAEVFWKGNNAQASGGGYAAGRPGQPVLRAAPATFQEKVYKADEWERRRLFYEEAWRFVRENPRLAASLYVRKLGGFFWVGQQAGHMYPGWFRRAYLAYYCAIVVGAITGCVCGFQGAASPKRHLLSLLAFVLSVGLLQACFYVEQRHRWAVEPLLLVLTAGGIGAGLSVLSFKTRRGSAAVVRP